MALDVTLFFHLKTQVSQVEIFCKQIPKHGFFISREVKIEFRAYCWKAICWLYFFRSFGAALLAKLKVFRNLYYLCKNINSVNE